MQLDEEARYVNNNYPWPGNVRELKNIAEQISVLATDKNVNAKELKRFLPDQPNINRLPVLHIQMDMTVMIFQTNARFCTSFFSI